MRLRSMLFVPADSERKMAKGLQSPADALILDLEDSVVESRKVEARATLAAHLDFTDADRSFIRSRLGRLLRGLSEAPVAMSTLGLSTARTRVTVFCISAFVAGIAGSVPMKEMVSLPRWLVAQTGPYFGWIRLAPRPGCGVWPFESTTPTSLSSLVSTIAILWRAFAATRK